MARPISSVTAQTIADDWGYDAVIIIGLKGDDIFVAVSPKTNHGLSNEHKDRLDEIIKWKDTQLFGDDS